MPHVEAPIMRLRLNYSTILYVALSWAFLVHPIYAHGLLGAWVVLIASGAIVATCFFYRHEFFDVNVHARDLLVLAGYIAFFSLVNISMLQESIAGDELVHASSSMIFTRVIRWLLWKESLQNNAFLLDTAVSELSYCFAVVAIGAIVLIYCLSRKLKKGPREKVFYGYLFTVALLLGLFFTRIPYYAQTHPPLRLFPLFVSSLFLGLHDFSFRFPGIVAIATVSFVTYRMVLRRAHVRVWFAIVAGGVSCMMPTVLHVAAAVEPSVWAYCTWVLVIYAIVLAHEKNDVRYMVTAGLLVGLGGLMRQTCVVIWPALALYCLCHPVFKKHTMKVLLPCLFIVPYLVTVSRIGHSATEAGGIANIIMSMTTGEGPQAISRSTSWLWLIFSLPGIVYGVTRSRSAIRWFYFSFIPAYALFFYVSRGLWGFGRYQAEFVAPFILLTLYLCTSEMPKRAHIAVATILIFLGLYGVHANRVMHQDVHYLHWGQKRITTEAYFPYKKAISFVQRQNTGGRFIVIGGTPFYGSSMLWLRGFTWRESMLFDQLNEAWRELVSDADVTLEEFHSFLREHEIDLFIVQFGDRRERMHRSVGLQRLMDDIATSYAHEPGTSPFQRRLTCVSHVGGSLDVYGAQGRRYFRER